MVTWDGAVHLEASLARYNPYDGLSAVLRGSTLCQVVLGRPKAVDGSLQSGGFPHGTWNIQKHWTVNSN